MELVLSAAVVVDTNVADEESLLRDWHAEQLGAPCLQRADGLLRRHLDRTAVDDEDVRDGCSVDGRGEVTVRRDAEGRARVVLSQFAGWP